MDQYRVGFLVGSLARGSINRLLASALGRLAPSELSLSEIPIRDLPLYSYDYDGDYPPMAQAFKQAIVDVDAVLFVTPEYNRSIPGALKNAIDWASRPYGHNAFSRKPSAVIGTSATPPQRAQLLQLAANECSGGLHPVQARPHNGLRHRDRQLDGRVLAQLHARASYLHRARVHRAAA